MTLLYFITTILLTSIITLILVRYYQHKKIKQFQCPFNDACTKYSNIHTPEAAIRIIKLLMENSKDVKNKSPVLKEYLNEILSWKLSKD